jgi:hypothetical protein
MVSDTTSLAIPTAQVMIPATNCRVATFLCLRRLGIRMRLQKHQEMLWNPNGSSQRIYWLRFGGSEAVMVSEFGLIFGLL